MKQITAVLLVLLALLAPSQSWGRGGQSADDCPAGSKDPDCKK
jgi:hypothetical protein